MPHPALCVQEEAEQAQKPDPFSVLEHSSQGTVETVVDPLTVRMRDGRTIHLAGLDFPDYDPYAPGPLSVTAVNILRDFLEGETVKISRTKNEKAGRINRMGHEIAHLTRTGDDIWVQGMVVGLGLARVRTEKNNPEMAAEMYEIEQAARAGKLGLWALESFAIATPENARSFIGSFQIVEGRVRSAAMKQNRVYLNFGDNWKTDFTVSISPEDRRAFTKAGLNPLDWNGDTLRVRGWIGSFNGPMMEIDHPQAVQIVQVGAPDAAADPQTRTQEKPPPARKKIPEKPVLKPGDALPGGNG